ncbi:hypothetical protein TNIN_220131 [Trichonephila inaurata madagascariensis]|uniref:Uncharacterized protein n=1 Tax=Trichonephila inaurata madagascariensis TaxID=2747483 RepID=A0A8X7CBM0_9ARAC|nr:hypothetical protein TNIN_220131 [Trichonephila inaurata madagascariensis]
MKGQCDLRYCSIRGLTQVGDNKNKKQFPDKQEVEEVSDKTLLEADSFFMDEEKENKAGKNKRRSIELWLILVMVSSL